MEQGPVLIVGAGMAGYAVARELKQRAFSREVHLLSADDGGYYAKPLLSHAVSRGKPARSLVTPGHQAALQFGVRLTPHARVTHVDLSQRVVSTEAGQVHAYAQLVVATGARPVSPWQGRAVFSVNTAQDLAQLEPRLQAATRVLVAGAGFVGLEFANDWAKAGKQVSVVSAAPPLSTLLPEAACAWLQERLERAGVAFMRGNLRLKEAGAGVTAFVDDQPLDGEFDVVLSAAGLRSDVELWAQAGLATGTHGVVVDEHFETNVQGVFALGDVMEYHGRAWRFVSALNHAAKVIAARLSGEPARESFGRLGVNLKCPDAPLTLTLPQGVTVPNWDVDQASGETLVLRAHHAGAPAGYLLGGTATSRRKELETWLSESTTAG